MNIYEKLQECRVELQNMEIKKSGQNNFAKYSYYELGDFLPKINKLFSEKKLFSRVSFNSELATLTIINTEKPEEQVEFTSPMASAQLKGCHDIQNIGAVETYQRRYLYMAALEIVEHDALDATTGNGYSEKQKKEAQEAAADGPPEFMQNICLTCGEEMTKAQVTVSQKNHGKNLCPKCQQKEAK